MREHTHTSQQHSLAILARSLFTHEKSNGDTQLEHRGPSITKSSARSAVRPWVLVGDDLRLRVAASAMLAVALARAERLAQVARRAVERVGAHVLLKKGEILRPVGWQAGR